ncbi:nicotinamidase-like [Bombus pyrosoma]|uniref:nicotinamidase-like n=1 Tax=Bombus pyrosoma TaxID=396416 RepID=UPI001CB89772|nr:nicotinamidase-like [Bombus pyrosoma]
MVDPLMYMLKDPEGDFNFANFRAMCSSVFKDDDIRKDEWRIREIFDLFDLDKDGVLKEEELTRFGEWTRKLSMPKTALVIVDVQNDFIDGSLSLRTCEAKQDGADVVEPINNLLKNGSFSKIIYSLDWHPENHISFYENLHLRELCPNSKIKREDAKLLDTVIFADPYLEQILWPKHCVMNTWGAELHKDLVIVPGSIQIRKGQNPDMEAYSVFFDNNFKGSMELHAILKKEGVDYVFVCGLAYDICVKATCLDGLRLGYAIAIVDDCCCGIAESDTEETKQLILENGGLITNSNDVIAMTNEGKKSLVLAHKIAKSMTLIGNSAEPER